MFEIEGYENITAKPIKYDYKRSNELCGYKNYAYLTEFMLKKEYIIFINNMWCEMMKYIVELNNTYNYLLEYNLIKLSNKQDKKKQIFEVYYNVFKKIKIKMDILKNVNNFLYNIKPYISIQIRKGSCDFKDYRNFLDDNDIERFLKVANNISQEKGLNKWFIATDCINTKMKILNGSIKKGVVYSKQKIRRNDNAEILSIIEMEILSRGSYFIITNQSSYGIVSLYKSGRCIKVNNYRDCVYVIGKGTKDHIIQFFSE